MKKIIILTLIKILVGNSSYLNINSPNEVNLVCFGSFICDACVGESICFFLAIKYHSTITGKLKLFLMK